MVFSVLKDNDELWLLFALVLGSELWLSWLFLSFLLTLTVSLEFSTVLFDFAEFALAVSSSVFDVDKLHENDDADVAEDEFF